MSAAQRRSLFALALAVAGCARGAAHARSSASGELGLRELAAIALEARAAGAYRCAPEELALAEAELEFARAELGLGDRARADEHVVRARANARAALHLSQDPACRAARSASPEARSPARNPGRPVAHRLDVTRLPMRRGST
jgi:OOP family OmpA-OmpF porin